MLSIYYALPVTYFDYRILKVSEVNFRNTCMHQNTVFQTCFHMVEKQLQSLGMTSCKVEHWLFSVCRTFTCGRHTQQQMFSNAQQQMFHNFLDPRLLHMPCICGRGENVEFQNVRFAYFSMNTLHLCNDRKLCDCVF